MWRTELARKARTQESTIGSHESERLNMIAPDGLRVLAVIAEAHANAESGLEIQHSGPDLGGARLPNRCPRC
jgi:hypothetical protein